MEEQTITLTEAELNAKIDEAVTAKTKELTSKHSGEMATMRKKLKEAEDANLSQEEIEKKAREELDANTQKELTELRSYKKGKVLEEKLSKEGLPTFFKNDTRLLNAEDGDIDGVIKNIKKEFEATLPKGNQVSTVVPTGGATQPATDKATESKKEFVNALKGLVG